MENDKESEHEVELCKRKQQETMFYLPIYNLKWMEFILYESVGTGIQILFGVPVSPGVHRS